MSTDRPGRLYRLVEEYAALGEHHRTGTPEDVATLDWFAAWLAEIGARVERLPWEFDRYEARWELTAGGKPVTSLPLFYEGTGEVDLADPPVWFLRAGGADIPDLRARAADALSAGVAAAVVVTESPTGLLMAVNRSPVPGSGLPVLLAAPADASRLGAGPVRVRMSAARVPGRSANIAGRLGAGPDEERVVLTTPLSGWFRCAGERGTGIAICLEVARTLAGEVPLLVLGMSGHELNDTGVKRFLEANGSLRPRGVFHFGASNAAGQPAPSGGLELTRTLGLRAHVRPGRETAVATAFAPLGLPVTLVAPDRAGDPAAWAGESREWCRLGVPLISMAGGFPLFHSPEDLPAAATTPALLETSFQAALAAARQL